MGEKVPDLLINWFLKLTYYTSEKQPSLNFWHILTASLSKSLLVSLCKRSGKKADE